MSLSLLRPKKLVSESLSYFQDMLSVKMPQYNIGLECTAQPLTITGLQ